MELSALGRYKIRGEVGRGTMGIVYRGYDPIIDRSVAIKTILLPETLSSSQRKTYLERFLLEARIAGRLLHPNIVVTYDAAMDEQQGIPFIAMELVEGEPLSRRVMQQKRLRWQEALDIIIPVARALDYAHKNGVVHRDIKPANVLLAKDGEPKITDFGIAKVPKADLTQTGVVMGTPSFMSPEQLQGETIDGRSDLFSLTSVLYNLLVGKPPFEAEDLTGISHQILYKDPKPPSELVSKLPRTLDGVLARGFSKSPPDRYPSARAFGEDLLAVRNGESPKLALVPGEKTYAQVPVTLPTQKAKARTAEKTLGTAFESLSPRRPPRSRLWWSLPPLMLVGLMLAMVFWGPRNVRERARPLWRSVSRTVGAQVDELKTAYEDNLAEREKTAADKMRAERLFASGEQWESRGQWDRARGAYEASLEVYREIGDGVGEASILLARGRLEAQTGQWSKARVDLDAAGAVYRIYEEPLGQVRALVLLGNLARDRGDSAGADSFYEQAMRHAETKQGGCPSCEVQFHKALHDLLQGKRESAREGFDLVRRNAATDERDDLAVRTFIYLGVHSFATGNHEMASTWWGEARQACQASGSADCLAEVRLWEGRAALESRDLESARAQFERAAEHFRGQQHLPGLASALENLAEVSLVEDDAASARSALDELSLVRSQLGLPELEELRRSSVSSPSGDHSHLRSLLSLLRASPRTALSEQRIAHFESLRGIGESR